MTDEEILGALQHPVAALREQIPAALDGDVAMSAPVVEDALDAETKDLIALATVTKQCDACMPFPAGTALFSGAFEAFQEVVGR